MLDPQLTVAMLTGVALLAVIGIPLAAAIGLRGYWLIGAAPAFAITVISGSAVVAPWLHLTWSVLPVAVVTVLIGAVSLLVRALGRRRSSASGATPAEPVTATARRESPWWVVIALALGIGLQATRTIQLIGRPDDISQTYDNVFHLNAIRYVIDTGNASPLDLGRMTSPGGSLGFYPAGWHAFTSLVVQTTGLPIPVVVNAIAVVMTAVIWPVSLLLLTRTLFGTRPAVSIASGLIAAAVPTLTIVLLDFGVLYPFMLGLALVPAALAATVVLARLIPTAPRPPIGWAALALVGTLPGIAIAHPSAFVAWLALTVPIAVVFGWVHLRRRGPGRRRLVTLLGLVGYAIVVALLVRVLRPPYEARFWPIRMSISDAFHQGLTLNTWYGVPAIAVTIAATVGCAWVLVSRNRGAFIALGGYLIGLGLFVVVAALPQARLRDMITGSWFNDLPRVGAIFVMAVVPLAVYGVSRSVEVLVDSPAGRSARRWPVAIRAVLAVAATAGLGLALQTGAMPNAVHLASGVYRMDADASLLDTDEHALLLRVGQHVPPGVRIAGSPYTGAALAYVYADRPVLMPHILMEISPDITTINDGLATATRGDATCRALADEKVGFVLDFGTREVTPEHHDYPGLDGLANSGSVRLVDSQGSARLYQITACG